MRTIWRHASTEGRVLLLAAGVSLGALAAWLGATSGVSGLAGLVLVLVALELLMRPVARRLSLRGGLVAIDERPRITPATVDRFFDHGFDPELGWIRKPNTHKIDLGRYPYRIDARGSRTNPGHEHLPLLISTYGDSYTFCREVEDHETWQWHLAERTRSNVLNFGVGNYGLDQALIRLDREYRTSPTPVVIMGIVPSTIARILSVWKHYNEFGNVLAFKPRYILEGDELHLIPNPVNGREEFFRLERHLATVQRYDDFYRRRFLREALRPPYLASALVNWRGFLLGPAKLLRRIATATGADEAPLARLVTALDRGGAGQTAALYGEDGPRRLFLRLASEFAARAHSLGATPVLAMLPMKDDLFLIRRSGHFYEPALDELRATLITIDVAPALLDAGPASTLFRKWHYSPAANRIVADVLAPVLDRLPAAVTR